MIPLFYTGLLVAVICIIFVEPISNKALLFLFIQGLLIAASFSLLTLAPKYISATEVSLIMLLETIFSIALAWLILKEIPNFRVILGGTVILLTLMAHYSYQMKVSKNN